MRNFYRDPWDSKKSWEVVKKVGGLCLRQYIDGQMTKEFSGSKSFIKRLGILDYPKVSVC